MICNVACTGSRRTIRRHLRGILKRYETRSSLSVFVAFPTFVWNSEFLTSFNRLSLLLLLFLLFLSFSKKKKKKDRKRRGCPRNESVTRCLILRNVEYRGIQRWKGFSEVGDSRRSLGNT